MKVRELITQLEQFDDDTPVVMADLLNVTNVSHHVINGYSYIIISDDRPEED